MRRKIFRILGITFIVLFVLELASCRVYDAFVYPKENAALIRSTVPAPNGSTISYIAAPTPEANQLPRILYVHGTPGDATAFEDYLTSPIAGFDAVSVDRPGFGHTKPRKPVYTMEEQVQCLEPLLVNRAGKGTILVGHSLGGPIIVEAALQYPDRVGGLVILSGCLDPTLEKIAWYQHVAGFAFVPYMIPYFLRNSDSELRPLKAELEAMQPRLKELRCPIVIVHAPDDILVPYSNVDYMLREFPPSTIVEVMRLDGKSHWVPWNAEADVRAAIAKVAAAMESKVPALAPKEATQ